MFIQVILTLFLLYSVFYLINHFLFHDKFELFKTKILNLNINTSSSNCSDTNVITPYYGYGYGYSYYPYYPYYNRFPYFW